MGQPLFNLIFMCLPCGFQHLLSLESRIPCLGNETKARNQYFLHLGSIQVHESSMNSGPLWEGEHFGLFLRLFFL